MEKALTNRILGFRKPAYGEAPKKSDHIISDRFFRDSLVVSLRARFVAVCLFLYYFIEQGTIGLLPEKSYIIYRNVRISDLIMFGLIIYSVFCIREFSKYFKSRSFLITKILLFYLVFEFFVSSIRYDTNLLEYMFRLKGIFSSFLVLPFMLLFKRGGVGFFVKLIFPVAVISNVLYILTALTGIAFLPDVTVITQILPGEITVFRVYGGTFYGEFFFLGFFYMWITRRFRFWQMILTILFIIPHLLAFGRGAWAMFIFVLLMFLVLNSLRKRNFRILARQAMIIIFVGLAFAVSFIAFIPEADYYIDALAARVTQGQEDVKYSEGTYGTRVLFQNNALVRLWSNSNILLGIGMHPMWVVRAESFEEQVYYNAFSDVAWPATLAAYGLIGFVLAIIFQIYYIVVTWKLLRRMREPNITSFFIAYFFAKLVFDTFINFTYAFISFGLWGLFPVMNFFIAVIVVTYEDQKDEDEEALEEKKKQTLSEGGLPRLTPVK